MQKLSIWPHCFLWMSMMTAKILQLAHSYFSSILATISKYRQKIRDLRKGETAEESLEKGIPKRHSKGKPKKTRIKDNKECFHNVGKYIVVPDLANIGPKYLDPVSGGKEGNSHEDNYSMKEVPSNGLSDTNLIVHKSRPPERVKKRISLSWVAMAIVVIFFEPVCGASAESFQYKNLEIEVGRNGSMKIPEDIPGDFPFGVKYTPNNNSSEVMTLCTYSNGSLSTSNPNNSHLQGISCLPKGVFISSAKLHHAGTYSIILDCNEPDCPRFLIYNLSIADEPLIRPIVTAENGTTGNKTDVEGGGSNNTNTILAVTTTLAVLVIIVILVVLVKRINPDLCKRILNLFPWKKSSTSSNDADTVDSVHYRMIPASGPTREPAEAF